MLQTFKGKFIMAQTTRVHGDNKQVMNYDAPGYTVGAVNAVTSAVTVQPQGPKLDFGTITSTVGHWTGSEVTTIIQTLQQLATVYIYEFTTGATYDTLAVAVYPTGAWDFTNGGSVDVAVTAAVGGVSTAATATFTN
jgi:hypothetical protein